MAAKPRVHEIAHELGVDSKTAMTVLKEMGEYVKGPSSSIEPAVARRLRDALSGGDRGMRVSDLAAEAGVDASVVLTRLREMKQHWGQNESSYLTPYLVARVRQTLSVERPPDVLNLAGSHERSAVLAQRLPQDLPALAALLHEHLVGKTLAQRTLTEALESNSLFYAPSAAARAIESDTPRDMTLTAEALLARVGVAVICGETADQPPPRWLIGWQATESDVTVVQARFRFYKSASPQPATLLGFEPLEVERLTYGVRCGRTSHTSTWRLMRLTQAIPRVERGESSRARVDDVGDSSIIEWEEPPNPGQREPGTRLIYLRRTQGTAARTGGHGPSRDQQWFVRGHWREQWYPTLNDHKRIWIDPHLAGRSDAPVNVDPRVYVIRPRE